MTIIVVNQGEEIFLDSILAVNKTMHLFQNDVTAALSSTQIEALDETDFTEATFTGYASKALTGGGWTTTPGDPTTGTYTRQDFASTADQTAQSIYGYYVTRTSDGALEWFEEFALPVTVEFNGDEIRVTPTLNLQDTQD